MSSEFPSSPTKVSIASFFELSLIKLILANEERSEVQHDDGQRRKSDKFSRPQGSPSSSANNYPARPFPANRARSDAFEQRVMVRSDCVARIVGEKDLQSSRQLF